MLYFLNYIVGNRMNQTKKRLAIIKLAISMTDTETIQLQVLKLGLLKTDSKMREILTALNEQNYVQAQRLISAYIETPSDTIVQRSSQKEMMQKEMMQERTPPITKSAPESSPIEAMFEVNEVTLEEKEEKPLTLKEKIQKAKEEAIIEEFELFREDEKEESPEEVNYDALLDIAPKPKKMSTQHVNYDSLLNVEAEDVLPHNIELDISHTPDDTFFNEEVPAKIKVKEKDDFFDGTESPLTVKQESIPETEEKPVAQTLSDANKTDYKAISYIDQKFKNMMNQYPPVHKKHETSLLVDNWLIQISNDGYNESDIEKMIKQTEKLVQTNKAEAAQLLLVTAATESKYAQFRLARALYKGEILEKNLAEAFTLINRLAMNDDYPEAICDLAQFYESGIGISKDKKKAEELYKVAMDLGINRAIDHYERIRKENKGLFSLFNT